GVAGACVALAYAPLAFHAMKLLPVSLAIASQALALALLGAARAGRRAAVPLAGLACGVACLARAEFLLFAPIAFASLWLDRRRPTGARRVAAGLFAAGVLVAIAPATLHNLSHGDRVLIASSAGENLFVGNQRGGNGGHSELHPSAGDLHSQRVWAVRIAERETGRPLVPSAVSRYWSGRALGEIAADPVAWLALEGRKLMRILDPADPTDMYSLALERSLYLPVLYLLPLSTTGLWVLGAAGLVGAWRRRREDAWPLLAAVAVQFLVLLAFFVSTRLRVPLLFLLTPFAGLAVSSGLARLVERRRVVPLLATAAIVLLGSVHWLVLLRPPPREAVRLASVLSLRDRLDESLEIVAPWTGPEREDALALDQAGWVHNKKGHLDAARRLYLRALELGLPSAAREAQTRTRLAALYEREGDVLRATRQHDAAVAAMPDSAPMRHARGLFLLRQGRVREAADDFREAARLAPGWPEPLAMLRSLGLPPPDAGATAEGRAPRQAK
ncbi:MAG TPA: hypothetical protein VD788_12570, partial [Candidatus Polarisedimenticolaceae bacterium]|nr:hypothetical protein [Candidatus Polarisedimenticolaceae bacterium]